MDVMKVPKRKSGQEDITVVYSPDVLKELQGTPTRRVSRQSVTTITKEIHNYKQARRALE